MGQVSHNVHLERETYIHLSMNRPKHIGNSRAVNPQITFIFVRASLRGWERHSKVGASSKDSPNRYYFTM